MYIVVRDFTDSQDERHVYRKGDAYPRKGKTSSKKRIEELSSTNNKIGAPLIAAVKKEETKNVNRSVPRTKKLV